MSEEAHEDEAILSLSALADGETDELTAEQREAVLRRLATEPPAAARVAVEVRLRQAVSRYMSESAPSPSDALRRWIEDMVRETAPDGASTESISSKIQLRHMPGRSRIFWPAAAAAMVFLVIGLWIGSAMHGEPANVAGPVPASLVADVTHIHVDCSRAPDLHSAAFPKELGNLKGSLEKYLGRPVPYPDLSSIGYEYIGAGPCAKPLDNAAHLLYRAKGGPITDTVSLFVQRDGPLKKLEEGKVYWAAGKDAAHPMIVWRRDNMTFYLVGDADKPVLAAAAVMGVAAPL